MSRRKPPQMVRLARAWVLVVGGCLLGGGLVMYGQVQSLHYMRAEVSNTFILWRGIGQLTFAWQDDVTQAALWAHEVPEVVVREWNRAAWTCMALGLLACVLSTTLQAPRRGGGQGKGRGLGRGLGRGSA